MYPLSLVAIAASTLVSSLVVNEMYMFPKERNYIWKPINLSALHCPLSPIETIIHNPQPVQVRLLRPSGHLDSHITGYICSKLKLSIQCSVNFLGWKTLSHRTEDISPGLGECTEALHRQQQGDISSIPAFPAPNCGWMNDLWASATFLLMTLHPVTVDPYTGDLVDRIFPGGSCKDKLCKTVHHGAYWVSNSRVPEMCTQWEVIPGTVGTSRDGDPWVLLPLLGHKSLVDICKITFCGHTGWRLITGEFLIFESGLSSSLLRAPPCPAGSEVGELSVEGELGLANLQLMREELRLQCLSTLTTILATGRISAFQLGYFTPSQIGPGEAYRLNGLRLEEAKVDYIEVSRFSTTRAPNIIGYMVNGSEVTWSDWTPLSNSNRTTGPNGVVRLSSGVILIPQLESRRLINDIVMMIGQEVHLARHPHRDIESNFSDLIMTHEHDEGKSGEWSLLSWLFGKFRWEGTLVVIGTLLILIVGVKLAIKSTRCTCLSRSKPTINSWDQVETSSV